MSLALNEGGQWGRNTLSELELADSFTHAQKTAETGLCTRRAVLLLYYNVAGVYIGCTGGLHDGQVEEGTARATEATILDLARKLYGRRAVHADGIQRKLHHNAQQSPYTYRQATASIWWMANRHDWRSSGDDMSTAVQPAAAAATQRTDLAPQREVWYSRIQIRIKTLRKHTFEKRKNTQIRLLLQSEPALPYDGPCQAFINSLLSFFPFPYSLLFPSWPSIFLPFHYPYPKRQTKGLQEICNFLQRGLGRSESRNWISCIITVKYDILWQHPTP